MLRPLRLVDQFNDVERAMPRDWGEARLVLAVADDARCDRAAALLGPANPGRLGKKLRFGVSRRGGGISPEAMRRLLKRLDDEGVAGELEVVGIEEAPPGERRERESLRAAWEQALAALPADWSDLYAEVRFHSTDYVERAALLMAPVNPARYGARNALRFRCAHFFGYGVSQEMAGRCLERCDREGITGEVEVLRVLSDTHPVGTQGPVWLIGGRAV